MDDPGQIGQETVDEVVHDSSPAADDAVDDASLLRDLVLKAHPDVVPELLRGGTVGELLASVPEARAAYARIVGQQAHVAPTASRAHPIPGGGTVRTSPVNVEGMPAMAKIRSGLGEGRGHRP